MFAFACAVLTACSDDYYEPYVPTSNTTSNNGNGSSTGNDTGGDTGSDNGGNSGGNSDVAPAAPTGVTASVEGPIQYPWVYISWNYDYSVDHWDIYRSTSQNGSYSKIGSNITFSYGDENVRNGATYYYKVKAISSSGKASEFSSAVKADIPY